ncbi:MAG: hypothetical protein R3C62_04930 [Chloroflexota bacterium]
MDLRDLTMDINPVYSNYFLAYWDEAEQAWHHVDTTVYQEDGLISAEVPHFSEWAAGYCQNGGNQAGCHLMVYVQRGSYLQLQLQHSAGAQDAARSDAFVFQPGGGRPYSEPGSSNHWRRLVSG